MSAAFDTTELEKLNEAMAYTTRSVQSLGEAMRAFFAEMCAAVNSDPALLRLLSRGLPKKVRRARGRRIRRLERGLK